MAGKNCKEKEKKGGGGRKIFSFITNQTHEKHKNSQELGEREREREINGPQKRMHHMVPAPNKGKTKNPNMTKKTHLRPHDGVVYKST